MSPVPRTVDLAGVTVRLDATSPMLARYLDWHFGPLHDSRQEPDLTIRESVAFQLIPPGSSPVHDGPLLCWEDADQLWLAHESGGRAWVGADELVLSLPEAGDGWRPVRQMLFNALSWFLDRHGLLMLHAGLVGRDEGSLLLLGPTSSGKSTAALAALLAGWDLLADDLAVVQTTQAPSAFGVPKRAMAERDLVGRLLPGATPDFADTRGRVMLPPELFAVGWREVRAVVLLGHHRGNGALQPLSHSRTLGQLLLAFREAERPAALRRQLASLAALAGLPAYVLEHAADPDCRLARAADLLEQVWRDCSAGQ